MFAPRPIFSRSTSLLRPLMQRRGAARLTVTGYLGATPDLLPLPNGGEIIKYSVAATTSGKDSAKPNWFRITFFPGAAGHMRDLMMNLPKGSLVFVEADAVHGSWEDKEGTVKNVLNFNQRRIEVLRRPADKSAATEEVEEVEEAEEIR